MISIVCIALVSFAAAFTDEKYIIKGQGCCASVKDSTSPKEVLPGIIFKNVNGYVREDCKALCNADENCVAFNHEADINTERAACILYSDSNRPMSTVEYSEVYSTNYFSDFSQFVEGSAPVLGAYGQNMITGIFLNGAESTIHCQKRNMLCYAKESRNVAHLPSAVGAAEFTSIHGCKTSVPITQEFNNTAILMSCGNEKLIAGMNPKGGNRINRVIIERNGVAEPFTIRSFKEPADIKVCGNVVNFQRFSVGLNIVIKDLKNSAFSGVFADDSCTL